MATETTDAAGKAAESAGMPQLDFSTFPNQIFWLVVTLVVIYLVLSKVALPRIASVLAERQGTITNNIAAAEDLKAEAAEKEQQLQKAMAEARAESARIAAEEKAKTQAKIDAAMAKADAEIAAKTAESEARIAEIREGAAIAVKEVAESTANEVVAALGVEVDASAVGAAIASRTKG